LAIQLRELLYTAMQRGPQPWAIDEIEILFYEIEARFEIGEQVEQFIAQSSNRSSNSAGQLAQGNFGLARVARVDQA
jgi:hypothetical protein